MSESVDQFKVLITELKRMLDYRQNRIMELETYIREFDVMDITELSKRNIELEIENEALKRENEAQDLVIIELIAETREAL